MASKTVPGISKLVLERVRVFRSRTEIELGALTVFAGANRSGKSTAMMGRSSSSRRSRHRSTRARFCFAMGT
jgi:predicted ATPase